MTQISRDDVARLAELSRLQLTQEEVDNLRIDIANILEYVEQLNELDTSQVEPTYQVIEPQTVWREDKVVESGVAREQLLAIAPATSENQVKVPKVL